MMTDQGRFEEIDEAKAKLMRDKGGEFIARVGEHIVFKQREFVVDAITDETITLRPVRQLAAPGGRTLPGPIPSQRVAPPT